MKAWCVLVICTVLLKAENIEKCIVEASVILSQLEREHAYIPHYFNPQVSALSGNLSIDELIECMNYAEKNKNTYFMNAFGAVIAERYGIECEQSMAECFEKLSHEAYAYVKKYIRLISTKNVTRACGDVNRSVADYVSEFDVPLEYLGNIGILRFDNKDLTSLYGIQDLNYDDVGIATFANNCIEGSNLDPQFPSNAFQGLPNLAWLHLENNDLSTVPGTFFSDATNLTRINLASNGLTGIPNGLFNNLDEIGELNVSNNSALVSLSATVFADMTNLQILSLSHNAIASIPSSLFANNSFLNTIDLSNNSLLLWPASALDNLTQLKLLNLANNLLTSFNPNSLPDGSTVILTGNALTALQQSMIQSNYPEVHFEF